MPNGQTIIDIPALIIIAAAHPRAAAMVGAFILVGIWLWRR